jgi:uncharacterized membrane protein YuzA (DUF378 family)
MAATLLGSLLVSLGLDSAEFKSGLSGAEKQLRNTTKRFEKIGSNVSNLGRNMSIGLTAPLVAFGVASFKAAAESKDAMAQVEASLVSMGRTAEFTKERLTGFASGEMRNSLFDDDEILRKVTATLLTFGKVSGAEFKRAQAAAVDLSAKLETDLQSATILVGKALQDPIKGLTALSRSGIQFSASQKAAITSMVAMGDAAGAQKIILAELETQFAGSAEAARKANPAAAMKQSFAELQENIGAILLPVVERITVYLGALIEKFNALSPSTQEAVIKIAAMVSVAGPLLFIIGNIVTATAPLIAAIKTISVVATAASGATGAFSLSLVALKAGIGAALLALTPYIVALAALAAIIYLVTRRTDEEKEATARYAKAQDAAKIATDKASGASMALAAAHGASRVQALAMAKAERENIKQKLASARASIVLAQAELARARATGFVQNAIGAGTGASFINLFGTLQSKSRNAAAAENLKTAKDTEKMLAKSLADTTAAINAPTPNFSVPSVSSGETPKTGGGAGGGKTRKGAEGPTAAEIERRFNDELVGYAQQAISAMQGLATSAEERAELELRSVELARVRTIESIKADEDYSKAQKVRLLAQVDALADLERQAIERQKQLDIERQADDIRQVAFETERGLLADQMAMAETQIERKDLALKILALEHQERRQALQRIANNDKLDDAIRARAQAEIDNLAEIEKSEIARTSRANETDAEAFGRSLSNTPEQINEAIDGIKIDGLNALNQGLTDAIMGFRSLGDVAKNILQEITAQLLKMAITQMIIKPLANAMGFPIPGFAKGTSFAPGGMALVGERGPELVNLPRGSQVIPNHKLDGTGAQQIHKPTFVFPGITDAKMAREAAGQAARRYRRELNPMRV